ncbi:hypothetical protein FGO68_gene7256 [Halteria grandinella]|uniref:Uncharacterized protein n=1 Tax=Halteria grandinella TaxID=5974 RepID=A0A8J8NMP2_HALGN|nr:hypothetical protein FGO68_gene7256 [Halteria grandinella]
MHPFRKKLKTSKRRSKRRINPQRRNIILKKDLLSHPQRRRKRRSIINLKNSMVDPAFLQKRAKSNTSISLN